MIRGIGPAYAKKLLRAFGEKVFDIIEATPDRLREVTGIGPVRASRITAAWAEQKAVREIMPPHWRRGCFTPETGHVAATPYNSHDIAAALARLLLPSGYREHGYEIDSPLFNPPVLSNER